MRRVTAALQQRHARDRRQAPLLFSCTHGMQHSRCAVGDCGDQGGGRARQELRVAGARPQRAGQARVQVLHRALLQNRLLALQPHLLAQALRAQGEFKGRAPRPASAPTSRAPAAPPGTGPAGAQPGCLRRMRAAAGSGGSAVHQAVPFFWGGNLCEKGVALRAEQTLWPRGSPSSERRQSLQARRQGRGGGRGARRQRAVHPVAHDRELGVVLGAAQQVEGQPEVGLHVACGARAIGYG